MKWNPIDFQGIISLDYSVYHRLTLYLDGKEFQLATVIIRAIKQDYKESLNPVLPPGTVIGLKLSDAVEVLEKKVRQAALSSETVHALGEWESGRTHIQEAFWEYVEVLEECTTELFQQLDQVGLEKWKQELSQVVDSIKVHLMQRLEDAIWALRRLKHTLNIYRSICVPKQDVWGKLVMTMWPWSGYINPSLIANLEKTQKYLSFRYIKFSERYAEYLKLEKNSSESLQRFNDYEIFSRLDYDSQNKFKGIYQFLKIWKTNEKSRMLPKQDVIRSLRNIATPEKMTRIFEEYGEKLKKELFEKSRSLKGKSDPSQFDVNENKGLIESIEHSRNEIHTLGVTVDGYRNFLLRTDPNPYVRNRWGFTEWIVGPEPLQTKHLLKIVYDAESIDRLYRQFSKSVENGPAAFEKIKIRHYNDDVQKCLHEMAQPLTSRGMMRSYANTILESIQELDELGSFDMSVVDFIGETLGKVMRADWRYQVVFDIPLFHQTYTIHQGIVGPIDDRQHQNRYHKFKQLVNRLKDWIKNKTTNRHTHEMEVAMNDIKEGLQEFFAYVQRTLSQEGASRSHEILASVSQELLEYRYLFGNFFHQLHLSETEDRLIRNEFLFVDQYFESIENRIHDYKISLD